MSPLDDPATCVTFSRENAELDPWAAEARSLVDRSGATLAECFSAHGVPNGQTLVATVSIDDAGRGSLRVRSSDEGACRAKSCLQHRIAEFDFPIPPVEHPPDHEAEFDVTLSYYPATTTELEVTFGRAPRPPRNTPCVDDPAGPTLGRLEPAEFQRLVRGSYGAIAQCYQAGLARSPTLSGLVSTRFTIGADGTVGDVWTSANELADCDVVVCIRSRFKEIRFPEPYGGGIVTVVYPIQFAPE